MTARTSRRPSPGKVRGLDGLSDAAGIFAILAIDHRDSLRVLLDPERPDDVPAAELTRVKLEVLTALRSQASGVMLEPEYSAAQAICTRTLPGRMGFLAAIEAQGYLGDPAARSTSLLDGWGVAKAKRLGASGIKLLVLYRPDAGAVTDAQDALIATVVTDCAQHDVPLFLEPLTYAREGGGGPADPVVLGAERRALVVATARRLAALGPDVLKLQFPIDTRRQTDRSAWADACAELDDATQGIPWALLSGGDPYELFREQVQIACQAGASGFMVGRALWGGYVTAPVADRAALVDSTLRPRFDELHTIAASRGRDWATNLTLPEIDERWYLRY